MAVFNGTAAEIENTKNKITDMTGNLEEIPDAYPTAQAVDQYVCLNNEKLLNEVSNDISGNIGYKIQELNDDIVVEDTEGQAFPSAVAVVGYVKDKANGKEDKSNKVKYVGDGTPDLFGEEDYLSALATDGYINHKLNYFQDHLETNVIPPMTTQNMVNEINKETVEYGKYYFPSVKAVVDYVGASVATGLSLINKITLLEDAAGISVSLNAEGNTFSLQKLYMVFDVVPDWESTSNRVLSLRAYVGDQKAQTHRFLCQSQTDFGSTGYGLVGTLKAEILGGVTVGELRRHKYIEGNKLSGTAEESVKCFISNKNDEPISNLVFYFYDTEAKSRVTLKAGSTIEVWGV